MKKLLPFLSIASVFTTLPALAQDADAVIVTASPLPRTLFYQAQPVAILSGDRLRLTLQPTLGETLSSAPGVSSTYFGPAASRPIIRGFDGDRIRVLQNGTNTIDASATSADHAVSFDPVSVETIEVVRGPATLLYGPNAVGGVVNVMDGRIPDERSARPLRGSIESRYESVNGERGGAWTLQGGTGGFVWHIEGYKRAADELHIPGFARSERLRLRDPLPDGEKEARGVLPNSDLRTEGLSGGASAVWDHGFVGLAYSGFHTNYGTVAEREVTIDLNQRRWDFRGAFFAPFEHVLAIRYSVGISDYEHTEYEGARAGTRFENEGYDGRIEITHEKFGPFEGALGFQAEASDFSAIGAEAFLPPVATRTHSIFLFEEAALDPWRVQLGLRYDHVTVEADAGEGFGGARGRAFDDVSASAGVVRKFADDWSLAATAAFTQRAPTYQELFAHGPHIATHAFEIGDSDLSPEKSFSIDLTLRKKTARFTGALSVFHNRFTDFIGQFSTGAIVAGEDSGLPVMAYRSTDADFLGGEVEMNVHLLGAPQQPGGEDVKAPKPSKPATPSLDLTLQADYVRATDRHTHDPLPRIPPFRARIALDWRCNNLSAGIEAQYAARQNRTSDFEMPTDSYFQLNATIGCRTTLGGVGGWFFLKGVNLTDAEARQHTSHLKEIAPLSGRGIVCGMKVEF